MKILLLGADGQVGWELRRSLAPIGQLIACNRSTVDLQDLLALKRLIRDLAPDLIVNAAAYTAVDQAESESQTAYRVNAEAVDLLAGEVRRRGAWLVHYSTEYVFDGNKVDAYTESDETNPASAYGRSKLAGEEAVLDSGCRHFLFRTSWVYATRGKNFLRTILRLACERDELRVVSDQIGAPTSAGLIADVTARALAEIGADGEETENGGVYHLTARGEVSWHRYAQFVLETAVESGQKLRIEPNQVAAVSTAEYPTPAVRPRNSCLDTSKLRATFGVELPAWESKVATTVREILTQQKINSGA